MSTWDKQSAFWAEVGGWVHALQAMPACPPTRQWPFLCAGRRFTTLTTTMFETSTLATQAKTPRDPYHRGQKCAWGRERQTRTITDVPITFPTSSSTFWNILEHSKAPQNILICSSCCQHSPVPGTRRVPARAHCRQVRPGCLAAFTWAACWAVPL